MTRFHWVRHGPTHEKSFVGWRDVPADLSDADQIARLDAYLPRKAILISSDLIRSVATADAVAGPDRLRLPHDTDLREFDFGDWDGVHFSKVAETHPDLSRAYWETPGDVTAPNGESWNDAAARVSRAVDRLVRDYPNQDIILVAHFGAILTQVQRARSQSPYQALGQKIDNLSVSTVRFDGEWHAGAINHVP